MMIENLEPRRLLASAPGSALDAGFNFSQEAVDAAAGVHVELQQPLAGPRGRIFMQGTVPINRRTTAIVVVALRPDGTLDRSFSGDGLADSGLLLDDFGFGVTTNFVAGDDGYVYVVNGTGAIRLRGNGTRDTTFGGGSPVDYTSGTESRRGLSTTLNDVGGIDILRTIYRRTGHTINPGTTGARQEIDGVTQLVRLSGDTGASRVVWEQSFFADSTQVNRPEVLRGGFSPLSNGRGWTIITATQNYSDYDDPDLPPNPFPTETSADADVYYLNADGEVTEHRTFDIGLNADISRVNIHPRGQFVAFAYGLDGIRQLSINQYGRVYRRTEPFNRLPGDNAGYDVRLSISNDGDAIRATAFGRAGRIETDFGEGGSVRLDKLLRIKPEANPRVLLSQPGSVLLGYRTFLRGSESPSGQFQANSNLARLYTGRTPTATLTAASAREARAIVEVRYRAPAGIAPRTIGSQDLKLRPRSLDSLPLRLVESRFVGDTLIARYRSASLARGTYRIELQPRQIGTGDNAVNEQGQTLGQVTIG